MSAAALYEILKEHPITNRCLRLIGENQISNMNKHVLVDDGTYALWKEGYNKKRGAYCTEFVMNTKDIMLVRIFFATSIDAVISLSKTTKLFVIDSMRHLGVKVDIIEDNHYGMIIDTTYNKITARYHLMDAGVCMDKSNSRDFSIVELLEMLIDGRFLRRFGNITITNRITALVALNNEYHEKFPLTAAQFDIHFVEDEMRVCGLPIIENELPIKELTVVEQHHMIENLLPQPIAEEILLQI